MDFLKDFAAGGTLLALQLSGTAIGGLGELPLPNTPRQWGEAGAWFVLFIALRLHDRVRVTRRVRSVLKHKAAALAAAPPCQDAEPLPQ